MTQFLFNFDSLGHWREREKERDNIRFSCGVVLTRDSCRYKKVTCVCVCACVCERERESERERVCVV
jgi:hypothetical protein